MSDAPLPNSNETSSKERRRDRREQRRLARYERILRLRESSRGAMLRGVHFLPSMATLGNALCGFSAIYVCTLSPQNMGDDPWAIALARNSTLIATYLIVVAAVFDALDGRLARMTRSTTDFGGQLDSLADVISFGCAPAFIALVSFKHHGPQDLPLFISRAVFAIALLYVACAAIRLARFNVMNEHGDQSHQSFQGLPSPGAGLCVTMIAMAHQQLVMNNYSMLGVGVVSLLPLVMLACGLLMVSNMPYPHLVNAFLSGRKSLTKLLLALMLVLLLVVEHRLVFAVAGLVFAFSAPVWWAWKKWKGPGDVVLVPPIAEDQAIVK